MMDDDGPLILTLALDPSQQARFDRLRAAHFPPERHFVDAHVTLFHHLPGDKADAVRGSVAALAGRTAAFDVAVTGLRMLGRGVAYALESRALAAVRAALASEWAADLGRQDAQGFRPHVTIQNKVAPEVAKSLHAHLTASFAPFSVDAVGLSLWRYRGGPWEPDTTHRFTAAEGGPLGRHHR